MYLGTEAVNKRDGTAVNMPDHFRCINICMLAYDATNDDKYLKLSKKYSLKWAEAILQENNVPLGLNNQGCITELTEESELSYRSFAGQVPDLNSKIDRTENILASGGINVFLKLWEITKIEEYRLAAERLIDILVTQLKDPDAGAAADIIRKYRNVTKDSKYDKYLLQILVGFNPYEIRKLKINPDVNRKQRPSGIGKRTDKPLWFENGKRRKHNPILLSVAAEITKNRRLATRAVDLARAYFILAKRQYTSGREHGCSATTVNAIARGHGRENNSGMVTAVLEPVIKTFL